MATSDPSSNDRFDVVIIGGGATGLGSAVDAASRGYRTALFEASTFGAGTSTRSTKLIHGGVRYLEQFRIGLVREALAERAILRRIAPDFVKPIGIIVPVRNVFERTYYATGLRIYDALAGRANLAPSRALSASETFEHLPNLRRAGIAGGIRYVDAQFDERGLLGALAQTARNLGAELHEHARVVRFISTNGRVNGVIAHADGKGELIISARTIINATGARSDIIRRLSDPNATQMLAPSRGSHIIFPADVLGRDDGFLIPKTDDKRVIFALPWKGRALVGTTEVPDVALDDDPKASDAEIDYLIAHVNRYLERQVTRSLIIDTYAGLRPLIRAGSTSSAALSREHVIDVDSQGLISVLGGKWTTYRRMAKDAIDTAARNGGLPNVRSRTEDLVLSTPR
jgi:glycerol-3-phosphate dehydrogenase